MVKNLDTSITISESQLVKMVSFNLMTKMKVNRILSLSETVVLMHLNIILIKILSLGPVE